MDQRHPTGGEKLIQCLEREGVEYVFGLSGGAAMPIFDALVDSKIKLILVRHEQGATHMADGYARSTGKPGVVLVTSGPGATNTVTGLLTALMDSSPIIVIEGPKACGKTSSARQVSASEVLLDTDAAARAAIAVDPMLVLEGPTPRLIDEWQIEPGLWNHVRRVADERALPGQFILSGSAVPSDETTRHTGAGRITRIRMRPMSLFESGHSNGSISLGAGGTGTTTSPTGLNHGARRPGPRPCPPARTGSRARSAPPARPAPGRPRPARGPTRGRG